MLAAQIATPWLTDPDNRPRLTDDHPLPAGASWMDVTGQQHYQLPPLPDALIVECWNVTQQWLDTVEADSNYLILWSGAVDEESDPRAVQATQQEIEAIRSYFAGVSEAQKEQHISGDTIGEVAEAVREWSSLFLRQDEMSDEAYAALVARYPAWQAGRAYVAGELCAYDSVLYEVVQAHTSQRDWTPPQVPALFVERAPQGVIPEWVQPTGAHDAYQKGDRVTHNGQVWESLIDANVREPGAPGTEALWKRV